MRWLGFAGLLLAMLIMGLVVKHQLQAVRPVLPQSGGNVALPEGMKPPITQATTPGAYGEQMQQHYQQTLDAAREQQQRLLETATQ